MLIFVAVAVSKNGQGKLFGTYNGFTAKGDEYLIKGGVNEKDKDGNIIMDTKMPPDLSGDSSPKDK